MGSQTKVIKIGDDGLITFSLPELTGRYLVIQENEGQIILSPFDLRWQSSSSSILKSDARLHYIPSSGGDVPLA